MKRQIYPNTAAAIAWWAANPNALKADCFSVKLPTSSEPLYVTEGMFDITVPASMSPTGTAITFRATEYGLWSRGKITSEATFQCRSNAMTLTMVPKDSAYLREAFNHIFDGAEVWVWTAYMPSGQYGSVQVFETKFQGRIIKTPQIDRLKCQFECADPLFLLNQKVPSRLVQSNCFKSFADVNCTLMASNYTVNFTAAATSTQTTLSPASPFTQPDGYFVQGIVTCLTGENAGLIQTVKAHADGSLRVMVPWLYPIATGDAFSVLKGCDKTPTACAGMKWANGTAEPKNWQLRFGGMPFVPPPTNSL